MNAKPNYRLILPGIAWEQAVRTLLLEPDQCAIGALRWNAGADMTELLANHLEIKENLPQGQDQFPLTDWMVLTIQQSPEITPVEILQQIAPRVSQTVVIVTLYKDDFSRWEGLVHRDGTCYPLEEVRVIGPGMLRLERVSQTELFEPPLSGRWSRTIGALGNELWQQVSQAHVLQIGCGRNGTLVAWQFAGLGIRQITLVDPDQLEWGNLDAMPGLTHDDVGQPKATALAKRLVAFNPDMMLRCVTEPVTDVLSHLRSRFDLIVTCVDADAPRLAASWLSRELLIPHLDIGTSVQRTAEAPVMSGDIRLLLPFQGCVNCVGGLSDSEETFYEFAAPPGSMHRGEPVAWHEQRAGSLVHLNSIAVGTSLEIWLSLLQRHVGSFWQRLSWNHQSGLEANGATVGPDQSCPFCTVEAK
tara:strand:+ start:15202 stop:16449 length:1248 start_codon:yes stop_codon:yes gene_type:complete